MNDIENNAKDKKEDIKRAGSGKTKERPVAFTKLILIFESSLLVFSLFFLAAGLKVFLGMFLMGSFLFFLTLTIISLFFKNLRSTFWLPITFLFCIISLIIFIIAVNIPFGLTVEKQEAVKEKDEPVKEETEIAEEAEVQGVIEESAAEIKKEKEEVYYGSPKIVEIPLSSTIVKPGEAVEISIHYKSESSIKVNWIASQGTIKDKTAISTEWTAPEKSGVYTVSATITDDYGKSDTKIREIIVEGDVSTRKEVKEEKPEKTLSYKIIHVLKNYRHDGGGLYFILIDPIDIGEAGFKDYIKKLVSEVVKEKGLSISLDIYDNLEALNYGYKYEVASPEEWKKIVSNKEIMAKLARHCIASFDGNLETGLYKNTLWFFIFSDQVNIGEIDKLSEVIEYNP